MDPFWLPDAVNLTGRVVKKSEHPKFAGGYADVWEGDFEGKAVAIKAPRIVDVTPAKLGKRQRRELGSWTGTEHPNILPFLGYCTDLSPYICLISPWMSNGTAIEYVKRHPEVDLIKLLIGIGKGVNYLHFIKIVHGDLRGGNVLITDNGEPQLSDFGLSRHTQEMSASTQPHGTARWKAPELHDPERFDLTVEKAHVLPVDVWSFGMTALELITKADPYIYLSNDGAVMIAIAQGQIPLKPTIQGDTLDIIWPICLQCWVFWPHARPSIADILRTLQKLAVDDRQVKSQLEIDNGYITLHNLVSSARLTTSVWETQVDELRQIVVTLSVIGLFCVWDVGKRGEWPNGVFNPWLAGTLTWFCIRSRFSSPNISEKLYDILWGVIWRGSRYYQAWILLRLFNHLIATIWRGDN
ncbi:kinase-like protein [Rickenella mellea]|uniref:Kinase-like protein n=1 Tax=Rickenella mellea TaxID=50990 RepID=A0A4Y7PRT8_9AGAM|nr:kinase-like protein [Rickenella mellea]